MYENIPLLWRIRVNKNNNCFIVVYYCLLLCVPRDKCATKPFHSSSKLDYYEKRKVKIEFVYTIKKHIELQQQDRLSLCAPIVMGNEKRQKNIRC